MEIGIKGHCIVDEQGNAVDGLPDGSEKPVKVVDGFVLGANSPEY